MGAMDALFSAPSATWLRLRRPPSTRDDARLLEEVARDLRWGPRAGAHLTLDLRVGRAARRPLDEYVFPLVQRLGPVRFDAVFAERSPADDSFIRVSPSAITDATAEPQVRVRLTASATTIDWKQQLHDACRAVTPQPAPPGPVAVRLRLGVSRQRNWSALWKPALDALGPVLGVPDPTRPYLAADDRITRLELHRRLDETVGHRVDVELWWTPVR
jgi:hypothetical protein